jgi:nucleoid-associated protein YgaU
MADGGELIKAKIETTEGQTQAVEFLYNPDAITFTKEVKWTPTTKPTSNSPDVDFAGGYSGEFSISNVVFDTTLPLGKTQGQGTGDDVRKHTQALLDLMEIDKTLKPPQPPKCRFIWGSFQSFEVYVKKVQLKFELFDRGGKPIRATATITFQQATDLADLPPQNPTSRSHARKIWTVVEGETLDWIAYQEYGDPSAWRHIAETNQLANPLKLRPGQILKLVPRS